MNKVGIFVTSLLMTANIATKAQAHNAEKLLVTTNPLEAAMKKVAGGQNFNIKTLTHDEFVPQKTMIENNPKVKLSGGGKDPDIKHFRNGNIKSRTIFHENGQIASQENFYKNYTNQVKEKQTYYPDGLKKSETYYNIDGKPAYAAEFYENGTLKRRFEAGYNASGQKIWEDETILFDGDCSCDNKSGKFTEKFFNNDGKITSLYTMQKYAKDSIVETMEDSKISYKNVFRVNEKGEGIIQSSRTTFKKSDGSIKRELVEDYYKDGSLKYEKSTSWKKGQPVSEYESSYHENGYTATYREGDFNKSTISHYDTEGNLISNYSVDANGHEIERWK